MFLSFVSTISSQLNNTRQRLNLALCFILAMWSSSNSIALEFISDSEMEDVHGDSINISHDYDEKMSEVDVRKHEHNLNKDEGILEANPQLREAMSNLKIKWVDGHCLPVSEHNFEQLTHTDADENLNDTVPSHINQLTEREYLQLVEIKCNQNIHQQRLNSARSFIEYQMSNSGEANLNQLEQVSSGSSAEPPQTALPTEINITLPALPACPPFGC